MSDEGVTYSFKDLFDKFDDRLKDGFRDLNNRLDSIDRKIDSKADNTRVAELEKRHAEYEISVSSRFDKIDGPDGRLKKVEDFILTNSAVSLVKGKGLAFLSALAIAVISALVYVALTGGHL